jgi:hypothetical protein
VFSKSGDGGFLSCYSNKELFGDLPKNAKKINLRIENENIPFLLSIIDL